MTGKKFVECSQLLLYNPHRSYERVWTSKTRVQVGTRTQPGCHQKFGKFFHDNCFINYLLYSGISPFSEGPSPDYLRRFRIDFCMHMHAQHTYYSTHIMLCLKTVTCHKHFVMNYRLFVICTHTGCTSAEATNGNVTAGVNNPVGYVKTRKCAGNRHQPAMRRVWKLQLYSEDVCMSCWWS